MTTPVQRPIDDPSGGLGLSHDHFVAVAARALGHEARDDSGAGGLALPTGASALAESREIVARAIRRLVSEKHDWSFMTQRVSITFDPEGDGPLNMDGDEARYRMPWWFGGKPESDFFYTDSSAPAVSVRVVEHREIAERTVQNRASGDPMLCAFRRLPQSDSGLLTGWEAVFDPAPSRALTVECQARAYPRNMLAGSDVFFAGLELNDALERRIELEGAERRNELDVIPTRRQSYEEALIRAKAIDDANKPRRAGQLRRVMSLDRDRLSLDRRPYGGAPAYFEGQRVSL